MPNRPIQVKHDENIAIVSLNRPDVRNSLNAEMLQLMLSTFASLKENAAVAGILVTGAGATFCAGADIEAMRNMTPFEAGRFSQLGQDVMFALESVGKPVIAAVKGHALGGGFELALACDFIVASRSAVFAAPEIRLGIIPGFGGTQRLTRLVGKARAKELIFTGNRIDAEAALSMGLVNRVYDDEELVGEGAALLKTICSRGMLSLKMAKEIIGAGADVDLRNACMMERDAFAICFATEDQKEGMTAFIEKRPAQFKGR
ncbi:enoyl-CoA hydratase/isomerase [Geotalea daltonii FRC-32]|uniref:Enoyl-CoA hydratase/isomerase n=1 Tax=Geotalea daltonii (strain DSM 22248 / JCM 15807 / FRC-32) TaxID=316067 RepID=B9M432_GEODF|nr:enoyl-CoA hydratase-related protein [Geotalea daltonii]ACM21487.1 enoyl-CoA hydratase/isomerase [Geotalea daltonii FRC-32]